MARSKGGSLRFKLANRLPTQGPFVKVWRVLAGTLKAALDYRLTGLAAEGAFFGVLSLPPLLFGLAGTVGFLVQTLEVGKITELRSEILLLARQFVSGDVIAEVIAPTLDDVLSGGRADVISVGFLLALWSGSRAANVFLDSISIVYGHTKRRGILHTRALSFVMYLVFLVVGALLLPVLIAGPRVIVRILPRTLDWVVALYWPTVILGTICLLAILFHRAVPGRTTWRHDLPGAVFTMGLWIGGSAALRWALAASVGSTSIYGPLAAPIALLLWFYLTSLSLLLGAAVNVGFAQAAARPPVLEPQELPWGELGDRRA